VSLYRFIAAEKASYPVSLMCRVLGVSRAGVYAWERRPPCQRALHDAWLCEQIRRIHRDSEGTYGSPRVHAQLRREGIGVGRKRVERLMREHGLEGLPRPRRRKGTTIRVQGVRPAPDLVGRDFRARRPNQLWVADIKRIQTGEGPLYLAAVVDCFSRACVGWSMAAHMRGSLVRMALEHAVARRRPDRGLIHHSDRGAQYTAVAFGARCRRAGIRLSMGKRGCALDNAVCEAFFATLERELTGRRTFATRAVARTAIFEWIEAFYNRRRLHSTDGHRSPIEYEAHMSQPRPIGEVINRFIHTLNPPKRHELKELISS
jgi:putative transposase